jgi:hypothetical protein
MKSEDDKMPQGKAATRGKEIKGLFSIEREKRQFTKETSPEAAPFHIPPHCPESRHE